MIDYALHLIQKHRQSGVLVDTNILLAYFVGSYNRDLVPKFKRTCTFTVEDFDTIATLFDFFEVLVTTPNILTEVSNLLGQVGEPAKFGCFDGFAKNLTQFNEYYVPTSEVVKDPIFQQFGLTDTAIKRLAQEKYLVLTDDLRVAAYLMKVGIDVLNFNHIRTLNW